MHIIDVETKRKLTFVGVVQVPDLMAVIVFEQVDDSSCVQRSHVHIIADYLVVVVINLVREQDVVAGHPVRRPTIAVVVAAVSAWARDAERQPGGDERQAKRTAERPKGVDGRDGVWSEHGEHPAW